VQKITLNVYRFDPDLDQEPYWKSYELPGREGVTVLEVLFEVLEHHDGSLAFRYSCREAICGACAMYINGSHRLACKTQVSHLGRVLWVSPLPHMRVIKDLVVDMDPFFEKYKLIKPYLLSNSKPPEKERYQSPDERRYIDEMISCILCGSCYSSCPSVWTGEHYLGPAALMWAYRFTADGRDEGDAERLNLTAQEGGLWRCHTIFNCTEACPKNINLTHSIQQLKKKAAARVLGGK